MSNKHTFTKTPLALAIGGVVAGHAPTAMAQSSGDAVLEEIIVTATRREASVLDIPYNISAVQGDDIEGQAIISQADLMRVIPGVSVVDRGFRNGGTVNSIVIRGINIDSGANGDIALSAVAPVSTYVDNTPIFANFILKDIDRVEVLRGPQGTLYGSGSLGGTVRYIMNQPDASGFDGEVSVGFGQTSGSDGNNLSADGMLNIPLSETAAFRVSAGMIDNDGIIDYPNLYQLSSGRPVVLSDGGQCLDVNDASLTPTEIAFNESCYERKDDADTVEINYARAALRFEPNEDVSVQLNYQYQEDTIGARRSVTLGADYNGATYNGSDESGATILEPSDREVSMASLDIDWDLGFATLTSNTSSYDHEGSGWRDNTSLWVTDRGGFANWFDILYTGMPRPVAHVDAGFRDEAFVQEFRLVSNPGDNSRVDWTAGVYYMDQDLESNNFSYLLGLNEYSQACAAIGAACLADGQWWVGLPLQEIDFWYIRQENFTDLAVYGEVTWHVSDTVHITGGARWFDNELTNNTAIDFPLVAGTTVPFVQYPSQKEDGVQLKLNVAWDISDRTMAYFTFSEGFRRGGANAIPDSGFFAETNPDSVRFYKADTTQNFEIGIKGSTDRFRYAADVYYVNWDDPQLNTATADWGFFMAQNGDSAETTGIELEGQWLLTDNVELLLGYTHVTAELTADLIAPQYGNLIAANGARLPAIPENVFTAGLTHNYDFPGGMSLVSRLNGYYQSDSVNNVAQGSLQDTHDAFSLWNFSTTLGADSWDATLYVRNIGDEAGVTGSFPATHFSTDTGIFENFYGNNQRQFITTPRTVGVVLRYRF